MNANLVRLTVILGTTAALATFQQAIPIRQLSPAEATSADPVAIRGKVFELSDGRVLLNDQAPQRPRLILFDASLATSKVVGDSTTLTTGPLRNYGFSMIPFRADSCVVADPNGNTLMILDPNGKNASVMTMPKPREAMIVQNVSGNLGFDSHFRLVYRASYPAPPRVPNPAVAYSSPVQPDTFPIVRADFDARTIDTIASIRLMSEIKTSSAITANRISMTMTHQPLPTTDEWAVLSDGSVGIVRGQDYHVDWIHENGTRASTPKMPFDWRRVTDEEKQHLIDSLTAQDAKLQARMDSMTAAQGRPASMSSSMNYATVGAKELPDYYPPIRSGSVMADREGNLWILPTTSSQARGGLLYDVVNEHQGLFQRVQLPPACGLAGFGPKGGVYLTCSEKVPGDTVSVTHLKRMRLLAGQPAQHEH